LVKFSISIVVLSLLFIALRFILIQQGVLEHPPSFFYTSLAFGAFVTVVIYAYLVGVRKADFFIQLYLLLMVVKIVAALGYSTLMVLKDKPGAKINVVFFLLIYVGFTALEVVFLYRQTRGQKHS
jgi:hypothetical protein